MREARILLAVAGLTLTCSIGALAHAIEHAPGEFVRQPSSPWPAGLERLVNQGNRVYGYLVNADDYFFFAGDTGAFNDFVTDYAELKDTPLILVLHPGKGKTPRLGVSQSDERIPFDWKVSVLLWGRHPELGEVADDDGHRHAVIIDLWLGGQVHLAELEVPLNVEVKSGGEIEEFIAAHEKARQAPSR